MKKSDRNLLLAAGVAGTVAWLAYNRKQGGTSVSGIPGIGALLPNNSLVPEKWRGQCSPAWMDAAVWGGAGLLTGYTVLAGKKLF